VPYRQLGFFGTPFRSNVFIVPTVNCLVSLTESPFFLVSIDEIEIIHFERVQFGLKNFDMCIIYKDYDKPVTRITAIPTEQLEIIKSWIE
jgi:nucleosome binding factor SPN SPT16 subunit